MRRKNGTKEKLIFFTILAGALILTAVFADLLTPFDPNEQNIMLAQKAPDLSHLMGTDRYGRDMLSRVIAGSRTSILATLFLVAVTASAGTAAGVLCGWCQNKVDRIFMRIADMFLAFPGLVVALAIAGVLGGGLNHAILALAVIGWPKYARMARSLTMAQKDAPYMMAAKMSGSGTGKLLLYHVLPNIAGQMLVTAVLDIGTMMMELAGLSFLGLGVKPPTAEWGSMMNDGRSMLQIAPWMVLAPGAAIFVSVMIFNLLGDTLRDYLDPKQRK